MRTWPPTASTIALISAAALLLVMTDTTSDAPAAGSHLPRGLRNNNPGNLRKSRVRWTGKIAGADKAFETFDTMRNGIRASAVNVRTQLRRGHNTLAKLIAIWAPASDGNDPHGYAATVARAAGVSVVTALSWSNKHQIADILAAMFKVENGQGVPLDLIQSSIKNL